MPPEKKRTYRVTVVFNFGPSTVIEVLAENASEARWEVLTEVRRELPARKKAGLCTQIVGTEVIMVLNHQHARRG